MKATTSPHDVSIYFRLTLLVARTPAPYQE